MLRKAVVAIFVVPAVALGGQEESATRTARYRVLPTGEGPPPFERVVLTRGPERNWQVDVFEKDQDGTQPLMQLRAATQSDPLGDAQELVFERYQLRIPPTSEVYDYRDAVRPDRALTPAWGDFDRWLVPRPARAAGRQDGFPHTCTYLGHTLSLRTVRKAPPLEPWDDANVLKLDRELWIATSRTFKDREERRLPDADQRNYDYVQWTPKDYEELIDAGMNVFGLIPGIERWLRSRPVFYRRGFSGDEPLRWPADLYRSNFIGPVLYLDEPSCRMTGNESFYNHSYWFTDFITALVSRVESEVNQARYGLEKQLRDGHIVLGNMRLAQPDFVAWETRYSTAYYQLLGGTRGFVHEGRYQLAEFNSFVEATTGLDRPHTAEEMFRYIYAVMRGAARSFNGDWGTAIYGQADPRLNPLAVKLAYDMGARYIWYWTSDHAHHLPWPEQLELSRIVRRHAAEHPRPSIRGPLPQRDKLITIPYGYVPELESPTNRKHCWDLWWVRQLDPEKKNEASQRYRRLMRKLFEQVNRSLEAGEDFDISIDGPAPVNGYREIVRITDQ